MTISYRQGFMKPRSCWNRRFQRSFEPMADVRVRVRFLSKLPQDLGQPVHIHFRGAAELETFFGMSKGGKECRRLVAAFERTFGATIFFGTDSLTANAKVVHRARAT